jgi:hypothetical protein
MSDPVIISLISGAFSFAAALLAFLNNMVAQRNSRHIAQARDAIVTLEKNTNSIKDALVRVTAESEYAKGLKAGTTGATGATGATGPAGAEAK